MIIGEFNDTYPPELDGVGTVVKSYAEELTAMGDECYYVAPNCPKYARIPMYRTLLFHGVKLPGEPYHFGFPSLDFAYLRRENRVPFDIVHAHSPFSAGREALRVARKRGVPIVATFHSKYYDDFYEKTRSRRIASLAANYVVNFYNHCDEVWAVNDRTADVLRGYGYQGDVVVMPNGTNLCRVDERAAAEARAQFSPDGAPIFLFVGQMNWKKNIRRVLEAVALYSREAPCRLVMVGQGPKRGGRPAGLRGAGRRREDDPHRPHRRPRPPDGHLRRRVAADLPVGLRQRAHGGARGRGRGHAVHTDARLLRRRGRDRRRERPAVRGHSRIRLRLHAPRPEQSRRAGPGRPRHHPPAVAQNRRRRKDKI